MFGGGSVSSLMRVSGSCAGEYIVLAKHSQGKRVGQFVICFRLRFD